MCPSQCIIGASMILIYLIISDINLDHLVNMMSAEFPQCQAIIFPFAMSKTWGDILKVGKYPFSAQRLAC